MVGFVILAVLALGAAIGVVAARQPVHSAIFLIGNLLVLAVLYLSLSAEFLAVAQIIVYTGAIMVLFLFVVTLLTAGKDEREPQEGLPGQRWWAAGLSLATGVVLAWLAVGHPGPSTGGPLHGLGSIPAMGAALWGSGFLYLAAVALMLLSAALGVLVLNRPEPQRSRRKAPKPPEKEGHAS